MRCTRDSRIVRFGAAGVEFLNLMRPKLHDDAITSMIVRAMCNYMYRGLLDDAWVRKPLAGLEYLKSKCKKPGKYGFRRTNQTEPFGKNNCVVVHLTE